MAVVEDDQDIRDFLHDLLGLHGAEVQTATTGPAGLALIISSPPFHLIILDLSLPGMTGWDLLPAIREHHPSCPVVILTASSASTDRALAAATGVDEYIVKPIDARSVVELAERYLGPLNGWGS